MRCDFYTYNLAPNRYQTPNFMAKPVKVNWESEAGKLIKKTLLGFATLAIAQVKYQELITKDPEALESKSCADITKDFFAQDDMMQTVHKYATKIKENLEEIYKLTKDPEILEKHAQLYKDAYKNRDLLKGGYSDLSDDEIDKAIIETYPVVTMGIIGKGNVEAAFSLDIVGLENFCFDVSSMTDSISRNNLELLKKKVNPVNTVEYRNLEENVKKDKRKINKLLGEENSAKRKELLEQIEGLKSDKNYIAKIKELKREVQNLYKNCENSEQIREVMVNISEKQRMMKELILKKVDLSPQEIINKVWTIAAISQSDHYRTGDEYDLGSSAEGIALYNKLMEKYKGYDEHTKLSDEEVDELTEFRSINKRKMNKDIKELIELIQPSTPENEKLWNKAIEKRLYERAGFDYNENYAKYLDLAHCKYLNELFASDNDFWTVFPALISSIVIYNVSGEISLDYSFDFMEHNHDTKLKFDDLGINYINWSRYNPNSFITDSVTIKSEDVKNKAVKNMLFDLKALYKNKKIPLKERNSVFNALQEIGVSIGKNENKIEIKINGRDVQYSDLPAIIAIVKKEFNENSFWTEENKNEDTDNARDMIYHHFMLQRKQEIDSAKKIKDEENIDIKVRKVNMNDVKYALCLGNHSHCCTALGSQSNEWSSPLYILSKCISAIEVLANGEPVGNTMMYMAKVNGELSLVLDDIELQAKFQNNDKIKDMIIKYAQKICKEIGKPNIHIYAGPGLQKVDMTEYEYIENAEMEIIGKTPENGGVYLDFDASQHDIGDIVEKTDLYRII